MGERVVKSRNRRPPRRPRPAPIEGSGVDGEILPSDLLLAALNRRLAADLKNMKAAFKKLEDMLGGEA